MKNVTVYFNDYCGHCTRLKSWLTKEGIAFTGLNTSEKKHSDTLFSKGINAIPFTIIEDISNNKTKEIIGFDEEEFKKALL